MAMQKRTVEIKITVSGQEHDVEVEVMSFHQNSDKFLISFNELVRLGQMFKIPRPKMLYCSSIRDRPYWQGQKEWYVPKNDMFKDVTRHTAIFGNSFNDEEYTGEGSASPDNISKWDIKSYAFEIACKRAKARYYKDVLGLMDLLCIDEIGPGYIHENDKRNQKNNDLEVPPEENAPSNESPDFMAQSEGTKQIGDSQKKAIFIITAKISNKLGNELLVKDLFYAFEKCDHKDWIELFIQFNKDFIDYSLLATEDIQLKHDNLSVLNFMTFNMASEFIVKLGNFSDTTVKPNR